VAGNVDLFATICEAAGAQVPADRVLDSRSLWPLLSGQTGDGPRDHFHYMGGSREGEVNYRGIRDARWKLVVSVGEDGKLKGDELYDLGADVSEKFNRIDQHPEVAARLAAAAQAFHDELKANLRPAGKIAER
jgi:arylsulfatase A-like enzyme